MSKVPARGRPADPTKQLLQKEKLLDAAQALLSIKPYRDVTIRDLAEHAELNSAMIRYYFENKEGLFLALLERMSQQHFVNMKQISTRQEPIKEFIHFMLKMLTKNTGLARLIHDEFSKDNSELGSAFIEMFPKRMAKILPQLIKNNTKITDDKKAKYAAFSLVSMIIMPFVGREVRERAWEISDEELSNPAWSEHVYAMFINGCG
ncbi:MAG: TetR family transcriptional regulator [Kangiella sp.]|nr:MAG: TetR family transcriptional regulator [Kangiella sp.]